MGYAPGRSDQMHEATTGQEVPSMDVSERHHYAGEKLAAAVFAVMAESGTMKDRLLVAVLHDLSMLEDEDFPEGQLRIQFHELMERILAAAPAGTRDDLFEAAFFHMSTDDARWIVERLHDLAFRMAV